MLYAAIDIHKHAFQASVFDPDSGEVVEERFSADREGLARWAEEWRGRGVAVAIEGTNGWRLVWRGVAAQREDRPPRRALAGAAVGEGDAAGVVDPARGDPAAARPYAAAQGARRGSPPLGAAASCVSVARGLAVLEGAALDAGGIALGRVAATARARAAPDRFAARDHRRARGATGDGRRRAAALRPRRPALPGAAVDLRDRADPLLSPARRDRRGVPLPPRRADHPVGWPRPGRRRIGRDEAPWPSRQGRLAALALGTRGGRRAREPARRALTSPFTGRPARAAMPPSRASPSRARSASTSTTRFASSSSKRPDRPTLTRSALHLSRRSSAPEVE